MPGGAGEAEPLHALATRCWNIMGGEIDFTALPMLCALYGIQDPDLFIHALVAIRDHVRRQHEQR